MPVFDYRLQQNLSTNTGLLSPYRHRFVIQVSHVIVALAEVVDVPEILCQVNLQSNSSCSPWNNLGSDFPVCIPFIENTETTLSVQIKLVELEVFNVAEEFSRASCILYSFPVFRQDTFVFSSFEIVLMFNNLSDIRSNVFFLRPSSKGLCLCYVTVCSCDYLGLSNLHIHLQHGYIRTTFAFLFTVKNSSSFL